MTNKLVVIIVLKYQKLKKYYMKWNEISCPKLQLPPDHVTRGLPPPYPRSLCPLSSTEFFDPPNKILGYAIDYRCIMLGLWFNHSFFYSAKLWAGRIVWKHPYGSNPRYHTAHLLPVSCHISSNRFSSQQLSPRFALGTPFWGPRQSIVIHLTMPITLPANQRQSRQTSWSTV